jgi:hypothetical protein
MKNPPDEESGVEDTCFMVTALLFFSNYAALHARAEQKR